MVKNRRLDPASIDADLNLKSTTITSLINEDAVVDLKDIETMAKYFKKPWSYMLLQKEEQISKLGKDHRTALNKHVGFSSDMLNETEWAEDFLDEVYELSENKEAIKPTLPSKHSALEVRKFFDISIEEISKLDSDYKALKKWVTKLEETGIFVAQRRIPDESIRAYSTTKHGAVLIVLTTRDSAAARIFSLMHEYCHILLNDTGVCDLNEHSQVETRCNQFAAELLMPAAAIADFNKDYQFNLNIDSDEEHALWLVRRFKVSQAALFIRLLQVGYITQTTYSALERRRKLRKAKPSKGGDFYKSHINAVGNKYAVLVLDALSRGVINRKDSSVLLGVGEYLIGSFGENLKKNIG